MKDIFCTVIVPVYNAEASLARCVESVLNQTCSDFELILVDDGSSDGSASLCAHYAEQDSRVLFIRQQNGGATTARNAALRRAAGQYVAFVDSDDWIDPTLLADCAAFLNAHPVDILFYGYRRVWQGGQADHASAYPPGLYDRRQIEHMILPSLLTNGHFSLSERLMRRQLLLQHQFDVDVRIRIGEDLACCVCCAADAESIGVLPGTYYNYWQHAGSVIHSYRNYTFENWQYLYAYLRRELSQKIPNFEKQAAACSVRLIYQAVLGALERGGLRFRTIKNVKAVLRQEPFSGQLHLAYFPAQKRAARLKLFLLRHKMIVSIYLADRVNRLLQKRRGGR